METKDVIVHLRQARGLSQEQLAQQLHVTRQAISRWETGETLPNVETLKDLSRLFDVSINTLLGSPRMPVCQRCGMPLTDDVMSREPDHSINEDYCQWCYAQGEFPHQSLEELIDYLVSQHFVPGWTDAQARAYYEAQLPQLAFWKGRA